MPFLIDTDVENLKSSIIQKLLTKHMKRMILLLTITKLRFLNMVQSFDFLSYVWRNNELKEKLLANLYSCEEKKLIILRKMIEREFEDWEVKYL